MSYQNVWRSFSANAMYGIADKAVNEQVVVITILVQRYDTVLSSMRTQNVQRHFFANAGGFFSITELPLLARYVAPVCVKNENCSRLRKVTYLQKYGMYSFVERLVV